MPLLYLLRASDRSMRCTGLSFYRTYCPWPGHVRGGAPTQDNSLGGAPLAVINTWLAHFLLGFFVFLEEHGSLQYGATVMGGQQYRLVSHRAAV